MQIHPKFIAVAQGNKDMEMLAVALMASIEAPDEFAHQFVDIAECIACGLSDQQVEQCKAVVLDVLEMEEAPEVTVH